MNVNLFSPEAGRTVRIGLVIYEKVFSVISEVNYRCGPVNGTGLTVSDAFKQNESEHPDTEKMSVDLDAESSRILNELTTSLNKVMGLSREITGEVILELLVRRCSRELRGYLFAKYHRNEFRPIRL